MDHTVRHPLTSGAQPTLLRWRPPKKHVPCPECGRLFKTIKAERKHYTREHNTKMLLYQCQFCDKPYASSSSTMTSRHRSMCDYRRPISARVKLSILRSSPPSRTPHRHNSEWSLLQATLYKPTLPWMPPEPVKWESLLPMHNR